MSARITATGRMRRLLALVPWLASYPGGAPVDEACRRFGLTETELLAELDAVPLVGLYPYTPDALIEIDVRDDRVHVLYSAGFRRPLRLTPEEGLALVAAGTALLATPGTEPDGPLARGLAKVAGVLGVTPGEQIAVDLGAGADELLAELHQAVAEHRRVRLRYYSHARDTETARVVDPWRLWSQTGQWYLGGWCHLAEGERVFRVDRIAEAEVLDDAATPPEDGEGASFLDLEGLPQVTLDLGPAARWVADTVPIIRSEDRPGGALRVTLGVGARPWLERLLLQLGQGATVVGIDERLGDADLARAAARRMLTRYQAAAGA